MDKILITTTPTLENVKIVQYCGIVTTNVVIGVNFFSDFMASFSDFFGGHSGTYQRKLDGIYQDIIGGLESRASQKNANAIIGLHIDFDEISGQGKQMFMATAIGTACKIKTENKVEHIDNKYVSNDEVQRMCMLRSIQLSLKNDDWIPKPLIWDFIFSHNMPELAGQLTEHYFKIDINKQDSYLSSLELYLSNLSYDEAVKALYPHIVEHKETISKLINKLSLFNPQHTLDFLKDGKFEVGILILKSSKESYSKSDLNLMIDILNLLDNMPDKGEYKEVTKGLFSKKEQKVYICPNGHENDINHEFCTDIGCGLNIKGLLCKDVEIIEAFRNRVYALRDIFQEKEN